MRFVRSAMLCSSHTHDVVEAILVLEQVGKSMLVDVVRGVLVSQVVMQDRVVQAASFGRWKFWVAAISTIALLKRRELIAEYEPSSRQQSDSTSVGFSNWISHQ